MNHRCGFKGGNRSDSLTYHLDNFFGDVIVIASGSGFKHKKTDGDLSLQLIGHTEDRAFCNIRMVSQPLFHTACGQSMACDIDDIICSRHDVYVAVIVNITRIRCFIISLILFQISLDVPVIVIPQCRQCARRKRQLYNQCTGFARRYRFMIRAQHLKVPTRHSLGWAAFLDRELMNSNAVGCDGPAGFRLPPMVDYRYLQFVFRPAQGVRIGSLSSQKKSA